MDAKAIEKYAELMVRVGVNVQPGQTLMIGAGGAGTAIECVDFVRLVAEKAYDAGARRVRVNWDDEQLARLTLERAPIEALREYPAQLAAWFEQAAEEGAAFLYISGSNPNLLQGIDPVRVAQARQAAQQALAGFSQHTNRLRVSWTIGAVPTRAWAASVFPNLSEADGINALWELILRATRADLDDPVAAWQQHERELTARKEVLNGLQFKRLKYRAPGTALSIALPERHVWLGGGAANAKGIPFQPNMPTEELFTVPLRTGVDGEVRSTLPLNYGGVLIENLRLRFAQGRIVDYAADTGLEALKGLVETDEGARYLGEVALVPADSPIAQMKTLFYNTLFDENAACHLAIGRAYPSCIEGGAALNQEELLERGANMSLAHVDFMIGSAELDIDGETQTGEVVPLFRKGLWAL